MKPAKDGDTVKVHYTGTLEDGTQFDSSAGRAPLEFTLGEGRVIRGFERAVIGMNPGESRTVTVSAEDGYGPRRDDLVMVVDRGEFPSGLDPAVGEQLELQQAGRTFTVRVTDVSPGSVTLDANHHLAGEVLTFIIELVEIV